MIIKSTSRKSNNYRQLITYLNSRVNISEVPWILARNHNCFPIESDKIIKSFMVNDKLRNKRKNGVAIYHDIISLPAQYKNVCLEKPWLLEELVRSYIEKRSSNALSYALPHFHQNDNPHLHIVFSANEKESSKSVRISKREFKELKKEIILEFEMLFLEKKVQKQINI